MYNKIDKKKIDKYFKLTEEALKKINIHKKPKLKEKNLYLVARDFFDMAQRYFNDAKYFKKKGDWVTAFASLNYAHGWLDAGARLGIFDVKGDSRLFTVDEEWTSS